MKNLKSYLFLLLIIAVIGCSKTKDAGPVSSNSETKYSKYLKINDYENFSIVEIINPWDTTKTLSSYILISDLSKIPNEYDSYTPIKVPLKRGVLYSDVHGSALEELGAIDKIKGVSDANYFKTKYIVEGLKSSNVIIDIGPSNSISYEKLLSLNPDGVLITLYEGFDISSIERPGINLIKFVDNLEEDPLGRAEWIRFLGRLFGEKDKSDKIFNSVVEEYESLKKSVDKEGKRPKILAENMYQGVWYVPGGKSYQARIIEDAGGDYLWKDDKSTGSLSLTYEDVLKKGKDSDIWLLKVYGEDLTKESLLKMDSRYKYFDCVDRGDVYYANTEKVRLFEEFPYHPERLLSDYIMIFRGDSAKDSSLRYFKRIGE